jgi:hypothetical protein
MENKSASIWPRLEDKFTSLSVSQGLQEVGLTGDSDGMVAGEPSYRLDTLIYHLTSRATAAGHPVTIRFDPPVADGAVNVFVSSDRCEIMAHGKNMANAMGMALDEYLLRFSEG